MLVMYVCVLYVCMYECMHVHVPMYIIMIIDGQMHGHILYSCMYMHTNTPLWLTFSSWFYFLLQC